MKIRNQEAKRINIKKIYIDDCPEYNGYKVSIVVNDKYIEFINKGKYINDILKDIKIYTDVLGENYDNDYIRI